MKKLTILVLISLLVGCAGVDTFRIITVPEQAQVYVDGRYSGLTPYTVNNEWYKLLWYRTGERFHLTIDKEGYKAIEKDVSVKEERARKGSGGRAGGSDSASGESYLYTFHLEPLKSN